MRFRIRDLMAAVFSLALILAVWHLFPTGRLGGIVSLAAFLGMAAPLRWYRGRHPGPLSGPQRAGVLAFLVLGGIGYILMLGLILRDFPGLPSRIAAWPG